MILKTKAGTRVREYEQNTSTPLKNPLITCVENFTLLFLSCTFFYIRSTFHKKKKVWESCFHSRNTLLKTLVHPTLIAIQMFEFKT